MGLEPAQNEAKASSAIKRKEEEKTRDPEWLSISRVGGVASLGLDR